MHRALDLAGSALFLTSPNPRVGCVLVDGQGRVIGEGHTQRAGGPHAEVMALRDAAARGHGTHGATAYVTLEPCSHHGRTGPCCDALVAAGITKVVAAVADPNPLVVGNGFARLRAAGVAVEVCDAQNGGSASRDLNIGFFSRMVRKTPWVRLKAAMSLDGKTALADGSSQWITGEAARADGHHWRARACTILTGIGTVLADDPALDVRYIDTPRQPRLVVLDSQLRTPPTARIFAASRQMLIYCAQEDAGRRAALEAAGAVVVCLPAANAAGIDLPALMRDLGQREVNELHVEAGGLLNGALLQAGLVDELVLYQAPVLLGQGQDAFGGMALAQLQDAPQLEMVESTTIGADQRIVARLSGHYDF
ncbi:bifunctional diaminohydroxyphosphoribosylaminopyrimidine deaminase/5-amino-6-(5-phosphoribosylamino)uracil reductase RibD [Comamonas odontotermitis]|uniref:bifunctional diaminohydroxyphosphoribosylaminopyrimidine deaminase/5-amino-6-(5-phosphoribosylamino)uracil reductase RibD n=1 Tax=Comamonas odontotermitis TaxID=379895 RepID=UPI001CC6F11D|nr:bifunctional diaminohydroxyphosphoribosylaminopyrimidine deaminase/5-amino-6-(5-phosphoribosylamino)uracil reductase RibD [Comamonas odontotermitis]UBB18996.1 bifunctional diaminohydroxyphosphoribosylaminopyrimidine deaminase/5-amino-6-(5-phosphoribosylamino)uracil reductase RibD [Comamonas odontotermitis]